MHVILRDRNGQEAELSWAKLSGVERCLVDLDDRRQKEIREL